VPQRRQGRRPQPAAPSLAGILARISFRDS
jgi:hypothetical protein